MTTPQGQAPTDTNTASGAAARFTKKPVTIEAIQWTGRNLREVIAFTDGPPDTRTTHAGMAWDAYTDLVERDGLKIYTLEGKMLASPGDWIIKGVKGEFYPCKPDIFEATYSRAALASAPAQPADIENLRKALQFYADGEHFIKSDDSAWDTVSGEPQNYWCDEAGTATVEDGSIARLALEGRPIRFEEDDSALPPAPSTEGESNGN
jgi:hypothetical protein